MNLRITGYACLGLLLICASSADATDAAAASPSNDNFGAASDLGLSTNISIGGSNRDASKEGGEPNHAGDPGGASVWYSWTSLSLGRIKIDTCDSTFDTLLAVYTGGSVNTLTPVVSNDQACGNQSKVAFNVFPGATYRIAVDGWSNGGQAAADQGTVNLNLRKTSPPANDNFSAAQNLGSVTSARVTLTNVDATKEVGEPNHGDDPGGASVWYRWTAPRSAPVRVTTCDSYYALDTLLGVYSGSSVGGLTKLGGNDDSCAFGFSRVVFDAVAGVAYYIAIDGWSNGGARPADEGAVDLDLKVLNPPANDDFADVEDLGSGKTASVGGSNVDATKEEGEPEHYYDPSGRFHEPGGASVWYRWTAPSSGRFVADTCGSDFDTLLSVYTGTSIDSLVRRDWGDGGCGLTVQSTAYFQATAGTTYLIAVDGNTHDFFTPPMEGSIQLHLNADDPAPVPPGEPAVQQGLSQGHAPPETTMSASPKRKSKKKTARFAFAADHPDSGFECSLDGAPFAPCASPSRYKVKRGFHLFQVQARDSAGAVDPTPAKARFKVIA